MYVSYSHNWLIVKNATVGCSKAVGFLKSWSAFLRTRLFKLFGKAAGWGCI